MRAPASRRSRRGMACLGKEHRLEDAVLPPLSASTSLKKKLARPRRSNADRAAETRANVIESTISTLYEVGYSKTTFQEISSRSGVSLGAIQHHFQNKDVLILSTLEALLDDLQGVTETLHGLSGDAASRCRSFIEVMWNEYYNRDVYIAVWEIIIGCRADPDLYNLVKLHRANSTVVIYKAWQHLMGVDEDHESLAAVDLALKFMRSASYMNVGISSVKHIEQQIILLGKLLDSFDYPEMK